MVKKHAQNWWTGFSGTTEMAFSSSSIAAHRIVPGKKVLMIFPNENALSIDALPRARLLRHPVIVNWTSGQLFERVAGAEDEGANSLR